jgi:hypothetical protein
MAVSVVLRTSADSANAATFGSDGGLYASAGVAPRLGTYEFSIDNSWGAPSTTNYAYVLPAVNAANAAMVANYAYMQPVMFARNCTIQGLKLSCTTAGTSSYVYLASYAASTVTGMPAAKIVDVGNTYTNTTGVKDFAMTDTSTVYQAGTIYWFTTWAYTTSGYPTISMRCGLYSHPAIRVAYAAPPSNAGFFTGNTQLSFMDNSVSWSTLTSAAATVTPNTPSSTVVPAATTGAYSPQFWWYLQNV